MLPRSPQHLAPALAALAILPAGCGGDGGSADAAAGGEVEGVQVRMDFTAAGDFHASPFPHAGRTRAAGFPNPDGTKLVDDLVTILDESADGFGRTSAVHFALTAPIDAGALPTVLSSVHESSPLVLMEMDSGARAPFEAGYLVAAGPHAPAHLLSLLPVAGLPLKPGAAYVAATLRSLGDADGAPLGVSRAMADLVAGRVPEGLDAVAVDLHLRGVRALADAGIAPSDLAGVTAFVTGDPEAAMRRAADLVRALPVPAPEAPLSLSEAFDDLCVYSAVVPMPTYQIGVPPFLDAGGAWDLDAPAGRERANLVVTVPRRPAPARGFPAVLFIRTGGGGERPLVDRGVRDEDGQVLEPGSGPALNFAKAGWAGVSIDGPHGGLRNVSGGDEQFLMFNITNPRAMRDNVRQSALEAALAVDILAALQVDTADCEGVGPTATFDTERLALMGHSMGATIAPLTMAIEPRFVALILSGAGGSWIHNVVYKERPLQVRPLAEAMLGYDLGTLTVHDPVLSLLQWAGESADPPVFGDAVGRRNVLMLQGMVDSYILPPMANATSLSLRLDLAGEALDRAEPRVERFALLTPLLELTGAEALALPVAGNRTSPEGGDAMTAVVVQHAEDGVEDGHEVVFQKPGPKHQYRCFLERLADPDSGPPIVPAPRGEWDPCPDG